MLVVTTADGSATAHSDRYGETYHSLNGAETEARHVFLEACHVRQRLESGKPTRVLEIGFGLGLNCLLTSDLAIKCNAELDYHAFENDPASQEDFRQMRYETLIRTGGLIDLITNEILGELPVKSGEPPLIERLSGVETDIEEFSTGVLAFENTAKHATYAATRTSCPLVSLTLHLQDATTSALPTGLFDAIYLDAFSPSVNPECWTVEFFRNLRLKLSPGGTLSTYSSKGTVRRALTTAGFDVKKMAGPPGKREILVAFATQR